MLSLRKRRGFKIAVALVLLCLVLIYLADVLLVGEFILGLAIPVLGGAVLLWFAYKLFLEPVLRQRKLDRIREYRAMRDANPTADPAKRD